MIKYSAVLFIFIFSIVVPAQNQQKQNPDVELPDFVITGKDIIRVQHAKKIPPGFVSIISEQFVKPVFPPANLPVKEISTPVAGNLNKIDSLNFLRGKLNASLGAYYLPKADLVFTNPFPAGLFEVYADALNQRAYVSNSDKYKLAGGTNLVLFINNQGGFLPGTQLKFHGDFGTYGYKLFGSDSSRFKRALNEGSAFISVNNTLSKVFNFSLKANDRLSSLKNERYSENLFKIIGSAKLSLESFNLGMNFNYQKQFITNNIYPNGVFNYFQIQPFIGLNFQKLMKVSFGINYSKIDTDYSFSPYIAVGFNLDKGLSLYGEYSPASDFYGAGHFIGINPYFSASDFTNVFVKKNSAFDITVKYQYYTYFEIDGGFKYYSSDFFPYFSDSTRRGRFDVFMTEGKNFTGFVNLLFHMGPYGVFYGSAEASDARDSGNNIIPYYPTVKINLNYGYNFDFGLDAQADLQYYSGIYTDILNKKSLNPYFNLGLKFMYSWRPNLDLLLELGNITNNKNYLWNGYQEIPLDISAGVSVKW